MDRKVVKNILILAFSIIATIIALKLAVFYMPFLIAFALYLLIEPLIKLFMKKFKLKRKTSSIIILIFSISLMIRSNCMGNSYTSFRSFEFAKELK